MIWRRISRGTDSEAGGRFVERMLSAVATCRQQGRDLLEYVAECHRAHLAGRECPSLLPGVALADDGPAVAAMRAEGRPG